MTTVLKDPEASDSTADTVLKDEMLVLNGLDKTLDTDLRVEVLRFMDPIETLGTILRGEVLALYVPVETAVDNDLRRETLPVEVLGAVIDADLRPEILVLSARDEDLMLVTDLEVGSAECLVDR